MPLYSFYKQLQNSPYLLEGISSVDSIKWPGSEPDSVPYVMITAHLPEDVGPAQHGEHPKTVSVRRPGSSKRRKGSPMGKEAYKEKGLVLVINYPQFSSLQQHTFIISQLCSSAVGVQHSWGVYSDSP